VTCRVPDIPERWIDEGKLHICAIKDDFSYRIVGTRLSQEWPLS
jgi:hypothetical protein